MKRADDLRADLEQLDGKGYTAYREIEGPYHFGRLTLYIDHVQADPFAAPSRCRVVVPQRFALFFRDTFATPSRRVALCDLLARRFARAIRTYVRGSRGVGRSGLIAIDVPGPEVLPRTAVTVTEEYVEARFVVGLPATGRTIVARHATEMLLGEIPQIVEDALVFAAYDTPALYAHVRAVEDQDALRSLLPARRLVAFVGDGSILPRASGVDPRPLAAGAVPFVSPESLRVEVTLPHRGRVTGMGIPEGVTLIVGGGFHGKSTLLRALTYGVYNHVPGDGRELTVTRADAVAIRAEDGRSVTGVDISPFIGPLPGGRDTTQFSTGEASGSTSQAANILEALEVGARVLLLDEDTSATNFMVRDRRMQELLPKEKEPITPFIDCVRALREEHGVSTVLVTGGVGEYFDVADTVILMDEFRPYDVTGRARAVAAAHRGERRVEASPHFGPVTPRVVDLTALDPSRSRRATRLEVRGMHTLVIGTTVLDLGAVTQVVHESQLRAIGRALLLLRERGPSPMPPLHEALVWLEREIEARGLDALTREKVGNLALPRRQEIAAAINRLRGLVVCRPGEEIARSTPPWTERVTDVAPERTTGHAPGDDRAPAPSSADVPRDDAPGDAPVRPGGSEA